MGSSNSSSAPSLTDLISAGGGLPGPPPTITPPATPDFGPLPAYKPPPADPLMAILTQQSDTQNTAALQTQAQMDTSSLLARYGSRLAYAGVNFNSPLR